MNPPRPVHTKAMVDGKTRYACVVHADKLAHGVQSVQPSERDSASVWCNFCEQAPK